MAPSPPDLVLLDAFGTLVAMDPPGPILHAELAAAGYDIDPHVVDEALRAEVAHYRARMHIAGDPAGLRALRAECGAVLAHALGPGAPPAPRATELLVASLRFRLHHDALGAMDALDAQGIRFGVVSNWDCALPDHLAALGVDDRFAVIAVSASVGAAKPDQAIFLSFMPPRRRGWRPPVRCTWATAWPRTTRGPVAPGCGPCCSTGQEMPPAGAPPGPR